MPNDQLLNEIKSSIMGMQTEMQKTYAKLSEMKLTGESHDKTVKIVMTATYGFEDIEFDDAALLKDGKLDLKEFRWRVREAWNNLSKEIQKTTQSKTIELLQGMQIPEDIKNLSTEDEGGEGGTTGTAGGGDLPPAA